MKNLSDISEEFDVEEAYLKAGEGVEEKLKKRVNKNTE